MATIFIFGIADKLTDTRGYFVVVDILKVADLATINRVYSSTHLHLCSFKLDTIERF